MVALATPDCMSGPVWPVVWTDNGYAYVCTPRPNGVKFIDNPDNPYRLPRAAAIVVLAKFWYMLEHVGTVPGLAERSKMLQLVQVDDVARKELACAVSDMVESEGYFDLSLIHISEPTRPL